MLRTAGGKVAAPLARMLEVLRLDSGRWTIISTHAGVEIVRPEPFDAVDVELALLWAEPQPAHTGPGAET